MENVNIDCLRSKLSKCLQTIRLYDWLIDAYILDFYVDKHWEKLPRGWQTHFERTRLEKLNNLVNFSEYSDLELWPLALLALRRLLQELCVPRAQQNIAEAEVHMSRNSLLNHSKLKHIFNKCVKPKKRHEISLMASMCEYSCQQTPVDCVVDFGAGLGHLARVLGYGCGINVCCLEMRSELNEQARSIDAQLEVIAGKHLPAAICATFRQPIHLTLRLTADMHPQQFLNTIATALELPNTTFRFGIIGLHPCGDLAAILMRIFLNSSQARFLNFASCCYMKLSTTLTQPNTKLHGYPLSQYLQQRPILAHLSYAAREISCHALEMYCDRLAKGDYEHLKVHSFRAAAERLIVKHWPTLKHCGLRSVKHVPGMEFEDYFYKAVQGSVAAMLPPSTLKTAVIQNDLRHWRRIVVFYTLRLMFAPLIESIILYDRALFLQENQCQVKINALFNPRLSPRNHLMCASKPS